MLFLTNSLTLITTTEFVNRHLYSNIMYRCYGSDRRNNLRVSARAASATSFFGTNGDTATFINFNCNFFILPNYRMINYDYIFNLLSSGVTCSWCI